MQQQRETPEQGHANEQELEAPATEPTPETDGQEQEPRMVPVAESIRYRKRAQAAEKQLEELSKQAEDAQAQLRESRQTIETLERRTTINELLRDSDAVDMEVARLLTEAAVELMDEPDLRRAVEDLRREKPYLFRRRRSAGAGAMAPRTDDLDSFEAEQAADRAMTTGSRRDVLRYLRLRRER